jgi:hypothetical protein
MADHYLKSLLADREMVLLETHQHAFVFIQNILLEIFIALVIAGIVSALGVLLAWFALPFYFLAYLLILIPIASLVRDYLIWNTREYVITNRRVVQISGVINKSVTDSSLEKVNDVKMTQSFWGRIFNFGDIEIMTASELGVNLFKTIGNPVRFKTTMLNAKEGMGMDQDHFIARQPPSRPDDIPSLIDDLARLRQKGILTEEEFQRKKGDLLAKM